MAYIVLARPSKSDHLGTGLRFNKMHLNIPYGALHKTRLTVSKIKLPHPYEGLAIALRSDCT